MTRVFNALAGSIAGAAAAGGEFAIVACVGLLFLVATVRRTLRAAR